MFTIQAKAVSTADGRLVCVYCGQLCEETRRQTSFSYHLSREHLYYNHLKNQGQDKIKNQHKDQIKIEDDEMYKCSLCNIVIKLTYKSSHIKNMHKTEYKPTLKTCKLCQTEVVSMKRHLLQDHKSESFQCDVCSKKCIGPAAFKQHKQNHRNHSLQMSGQCTICTNGFVYANIGQHMRHSHQVRTWSCDHCDKSFRNILELKVHKKTVDGTAKKKQCPECNNYFRFIAQHIRRFHRGIKKTYKGNTNYQKIANVNCGICGQEYKAGLIFNLHLSENHLPSIFKNVGYKLNIASQDGLEKEQMGQILVNEKSTIINPDNILCKLCGLNSTTKMKMLAHMKCHLGFSLQKGSKGRLSESNICPNCGQTMKSENEHAKTCDIENKPAVSSIKSKTPKQAQLCQKSATIIGGQTPMVSETSPNPPKLRCPDCFQAVRVDQVKEHGKDCQAVSR